MQRSADPMVSCEWLAARLEAPDIRIVDATWLIQGASAALKGFHEERIPGARFFDIDDIADKSTALPHMLPSPELFSSRMRRMGIGDGARVVVYDQVGVGSAARAWWMFRVMGHDDVVVLDGGFPAWKRATFPIETGSTRAGMERHFTARKRSDLVRNLEDMRRAVDQGGVSILDARPAPRFRGEAPEPRPGLRSGHMPVAWNVPHSTLTTDLGFLKSREELEHLLSPYAEGSRPIVCTCGSGVTAAIVALALARIGRWDAAIYDGSWAEWGAQADTPVSTGP